MREPPGNREQGAREKRSIRLELLGRGFTVRSDDDEAYVREVADFVNRKLVEIRSTTGRVEADQIALLAALDIADAFFREKARGETLRKSVRERSRKLLGAIDQMAQSLETAEAVAGSRDGRTPALENS